MDSGTAAGYSCSAFVLLWPDESQGRSIHEGGLRAHIHNMLATNIPKTLKRPPDKYIRAFKPRMVEGHTVGDLVGQGWSLGICCRHCPRVVEWTPPELESRFAGKLGLKLADLLPKLACSGPDGCGSLDVAIFPYVEGPEDRRREKPSPLPCPSETDLGWDHSVLLQVPRNDRQDVMKRPLEVSDLLPGPTT